jgi:AcrR family transcriptional regulator
MVRVAAAKGYEGATVADVVALAEVPQETFSELFADKESCFLEACDAVVDVLIAHVSGAFEGSAGEPWADRVAAGLRALVNLLAAESEIARMAMVEVTAVGDEARIRYRAALDRFTPFLEQGREASPRADELPPDTAGFAIGGVTAMVSDEVRAGRGPELPSLLPELLFAVLMPYLGAVAAEAEMKRVGAHG